MDDNNLKLINVIHYNGSSIFLNDVCMSHTNFQLGQVLQAAVFGDMIVITPAIIEESTGN